MNTTKIFSSLAIPLFLTFLVTTKECGSSSGGGTPTGAYDSGCSPRLSIYINSIKITDKKDKPLNGKDDVSFVAMIYHDNQCTGKPLAYKNFIKIKKSEIGDNLAVGQQITTPPIFLCHNSTIALVIYEHDSNNNANGQWNYACTEKLYFSTNNEPYGTIYIKYSDFDNSSSNSHKTYQMTYGEVTIKSSNAF